nr:hypothetical protein GCM10010200_017720 [Actinomadura rugatobispora]
MEEPDIRQRHNVGERQEEHRYRDFSSQSCPREWAEQEAWWAQSEAWAYQCYQGAQQAEAAHQLAACRVSAAQS